MSRLPLLGGVAKSRGGFIQTVLTTPPYGHPTKGGETTVAPLREHNIYVFPYKFSVLFCMHIKIFKIWRFKFVNVI